MKRGLISEFILTLSTLSTRRNLIDMTVSTPLGDYDSQTYLTESLEKNNVSGNNANSQLTASNIKKFVYIHTTGKLNVTLKRTVNAVLQTLTIEVERYFATTAAFDSIDVKNLDQNTDVAVKIVYS